MHIAAFPTSMAKPEIVVLIPESTRKARGGSSDAPEIDSIAAALPATIRAKLEGLREEVLHKSPTGSVRPGGLLPAYRRFQGNMYMSIPEQAWAHRAPNVEIIIASGLRGLVAPPRRRPPFPGVPAVGHRVRRRPQGDRRSDDRLSRDGPRKPATSRGTHRPDSAIRNRVAQPAIGASGLSGPPRPVDGSRPAPRRGTG